MSGQAPLRGSGGVRKIDDRRAEVETYLTRRIEVAIVPRRHLHHLDRPGQRPYCSRTMAWRRQIQGVITVAATLCHWQWASRRSEQALRRFRIASAFYVPRLEPSAGSPWGVQDKPRPDTRLRPQRVRQQSREPVISWNVLAYRNEALPHATSYLVLRAEAGELRSRKLPFVTVRYWPAAGVRESQLIGRPTRTTGFAEGNRERARPGVASQLPLLSRLRRPQNAAKLSFAFGGRPHRLDVEPSVV